MANIIDFSVLNTRVHKFQKSLELESPSYAFPYVVLEAIFGLSNNEIDNCIVDGSQDRGIDAVYIEEENDKNNNPIIHIFQFKYTSKQAKINNNFPGNEIDKLITIINDTLNRVPHLESSVNPALWRKIQDIQEVFERNSLPKLCVHLCGNMLELASHEKERLEKSLRIYQSISINHYSLDSLVSLITEKSSKQINGKISFIDKQYFDRSFGNVRAVIAVVYALDLIKLIEDKDNLGTIEEAIFEDNIRLYQGINKNPVNQAIYKSALDIETNHNFFYFNNGITMTCDRIEYNKISQPLVELHNIQIVNGSQTSHALFEAYQSLQDKTVLENVLILLRIYQTSASEIVSKIVQTTNSQTVINSRDLRANDAIQYKLETELLDKGYFYERKKNSHQDKERAKVLDAQVVGQVLLAFYLGKPQEVKYKRREIFGKYYLDVFDESIINANIILKASSIFYYIEKRKLEYQREIRLDSYDPSKLFIPHASFHILYGMKVAIDKLNIDYTYNNIENVVEIYDYIINIIVALVENAEREQGKRYSHNSFFRDRKQVEALENVILQNFTTT